MKTNWNQDDILTTDNFNEITQKITDLYYTIFEKKITLEKKWMAYFLFSENLNSIEEYIYEMCRYKGVYFEKRTWYNLSIITFKDLNRWCIALNRLEIDMEGYDLLYPSDELYPSDDLFMPEEGGTGCEQYCGITYCGEEILT